MSTVLHPMLYLVLAVALSALWMGVACSLVRLLNLKSPVARVMVFLAPLLVSSAALLRLVPHARYEILLGTILIASLLSLRDALRYVGFRRQITTHGRLYARAEKLCEPLAAELGLVPAPRVYLSNDLERGPVVLSIRHPMIVFPESVAGKLSDDEVRVLLAHELAHIRRRDLLLKWVLLFLRRLAFWNPLAVYPYRWLSMEIEFACDRIACRLTGKPGTLARTLCKIEKLETRTPVPVARPLEMIPRADLGLRARLIYLGTPSSYRFEWSNLVKTLMIFSIYWSICSRPAEFVLSVINP